MNNVPVRIFSLFLQQQLSSSNKNRLLSGFPLSLESNQAINLQFADSFLVVVQLLRVQAREAFYFCPNNSTSSYLFVSSFQAPPRRKSPIDEFMMDRSESTTSCFERSLSTFVDAKETVIGFGFGFTKRN